MNSSSTEVAEMPPAVSTVTLTVPAKPAGEIAVNSVEERAVTEAASVVPNLTELGSDRLVPVMVTSVAPSTGPTLGEIPVTVGTAT